MGESGRRQEEREGGREGIVKREERVCEREREGEQERKTES